MNLFVLQTALRTLMSTTCLHSAAVMSLPKSRYGPKDRSARPADISRDRDRDAAERNVKLRPDAQECPPPDNRGNSVLAERASLSPFRILSHPRSYCSYLQKVNSILVDGKRKKLSQKKDKDCVSLVSFVLRIICSCP
jgi:hypothetical protein